jgi:hypothetical protein
MPALSAITSTSANAIAIGPNGQTNPVLKVKADAASCATGIHLVGAAAASGAGIAVISSGTNENLTIDAKGSGTIALNPTGTGNVITTRPIIITNAAAAAFAVGRQGATDPALLVKADAATSVTGLRISSAAAASGADLSVISSGTNENLTINAKGSGTIDLNPTGTGNVLTARGVLSRNATAGIGYATGAGGAVTQATSRTTGVTLNTICGAITLVSAAGSTSPASFTVTNSAVAATDLVTCSVKSGTDKRQAIVTAVGAGSFEITTWTLSGTTTEQPVINFAVIKAVAA